MRESEQGEGRRTMEQLLRLYRVTSELSHALTPAQVASVIVQEAGPALGSSECTIYLLEDGGLRLADVAGMPEVDLGPWSTLALDLPVPISEAARTGEPVWLESLADLQARYPSMRDVPLRRHAWVCLPIKFQGRVLGVLTLGFPGEQGFSAEEKDFACLVAKQCAQALERAHLYMRERELREQAERARADAEEHRRLLELEHRRLQAVLQQLPEGVLIAEAPSGRLVMGNARMERMWGAPFSAYSSMPPEKRSLFHPDGRRFTKDELPLIRVLATGEPVRGQVMEMRRPDGTRFLIDVNAAPVRDAEGRVTAAVAVFDDITERVRTEQALREGEAVFRRIMASDMMGLLFSDEQGLLLEANHAFLALIGRTREEVARAKVHWRELVPPEWQQTAERGLEELWARGVASPFELELLRADGGRVSVLTGSARVEEQRRIITFVMDLTELKRAVRLRDEFLSVASHELKTPLTPLRLQLQLLERLARQGQSLEPERVLRVVRSCEAQVGKLTGLVEDLLDVSRLARGRLPLRLEGVDLVATVRNVVEAFSTASERAGCRVEVVADSPVVGWWDALRLEQVVTNLLTNALKYGAGKPVLLSVREQGGVARLRVRDDGIGIAPEHRARIFGKFERAVSERHYGGLGLGLHITQQIVRALGGSILVESEPGRGSTFTVELPLGARLYAPDGARLEHVH